MVIENLRKKYHEKKLKKIIVGYPLQHGSINVNTQSEDQILIELFVFVLVLKTFRLLKRAQNF